MVVDRVCPRRVFALGLLLHTGFVTRPREAHATDYFVAADGDDASPGTAATRPWRSVEQVNRAQSLLRPGDRVLFRRGDVFAGTLTPTASGTPGAAITYGAFGAAAALPTLSGYAPVTGFRALGGNVWEATLASGPSTRLSSVRLRGVLQPLGRYPRADAADGGYLRADATSGETGLSLAALATAPDFTGAELLLRISDSRFYRTVVTRHAGATLTFAAFPQAGFPLAQAGGFFLQNHRAALARAGDWAYDPARRALLLYSAGGPAEADAVEASVTETLVRLGGVHDVTVENLRLVGSNGSAVLADRMATRLTLQSLQVVLAGTYAIELRAVASSTIASNDLRDSLSDGIFVQPAGWDGAVDITVRRNVVTNTGLVVGMHAATRESNQGIVVNVARGALIEENTVRNTGYIPVRFSGSDVTVRRNVIDTFCSVLDDGGGVYTWSGDRPSGTNRLIEGNLIVNGLRANAGAQTAGEGTGSVGVYLDENASNARIVDNFVGDVTSRALLFNSSQNVEIARNTFARTSDGAGAQPTLVHRVPGAPGQPLVGYAVHDNVFVATRVDEKIFWYADEGHDTPAVSTPLARLRAFGTMDRNAYYAQGALAFQHSYRASPAAAYAYTGWMPLGRWRAYAGFDAASREIALREPRAVASRTTATLYPHGDFEARPASLGFFSPNNAMRMAFDTNRTVDGAVSVALTPAGPAPPVNELAFGQLFDDMGAVTAGRTYLLRATVVGSTDGGVLSANMRMNHDPWRDLAPPVVHAFGRGRSVHEFLVDAPTSDARAAWQLTVRATSGTTYLDGVEVYEVRTRALPDAVRLVTNDSFAPRVVALSAPYEDASGVVYCGEASLGPASGRALFRSDAPCTPGPAVDGGAQDAAVNDGSLRDVALEGAVAPPSDASPVVDAETGPDANDPPDGAHAEGGTLDARVGEGDGATRDGESPDDTIALDAAVDALDHADARGAEASHELARGCQCETNLRDATRAGTRTRAALAALALAVATAHARARRTRRNGCARRTKATIERA